MVRVVEPSVYAPAAHGDIFEQVIMELINPTPRAMDGYTRTSFQAGAPFDLLTFPEAFAPAEALLSVLQSLSQVQTLGCIHVGLRPDSDDKRHLFSNAEIRSLLEALLAIPATVPQDLAPFRSWFETQPANLHFNLGCLFTLDVDARPRICIHPKLVRSQYEYSPLPERMMEEANLFSLVTLLPADKRYLSVTIQPLICSDALNLPTDRATPSPLAVVNAAETPFDNPPDHIDVVSVVTHTPQVEYGPATTQPRPREWHLEFRDAFCRAAQSGELPRHHFATFILSNFETLNGGSKGGLSGIFQPIDPREEQLHPAVGLNRYGRSRIDGGNNTWHQFAPGEPRDWQWRGYIAALTQPPKDEAVRVLGFNLSSMLRDSSMWRPSRAPNSCEILLGRWKSPNHLAFADWKAGQP
ncbi:hypothetical protein [Mesorhizobium sp. B4-1-4]|uniref:hypothetical protein n=1 Tax=Mesorhizobium sp. B4-1-4 TaxID=2589888 RepID=UPI001129F4AC|nr:hypothetical protein [Mesorhizobium sp. B4-1-4]UCI31691.1 hypothetical protein FJW03_28690 [Mesorhizobium sp. B4-1-4]